MVGYGTSAGDVEETERGQSFNEQLTATLRGRDDCVIRIRWGLRAGRGRKTVREGDRASEEVCMKRDWREKGMGGKVRNGQVRVRRDGDKSGRGPGGQGNEREGRGEERRRGVGEERGGNR